MTVSDIALLLYSSPKTIQKYLSIPEDQIPESKVLVREWQHQLTVKQKEQEIKEAKEMALALAGYLIEEIASQMHRTYKTMQNYLNSEYSITNGPYNVRIPEKLASYENEVIKLRSQGLIYQKYMRLFVKRDILAVWLHYECLCKKKEQGCTNYSVNKIKVIKRKEEERNIGGVLCRVH